MNIPRRQPLHSHRNFGIPPRMEEEDRAPYIFVWIAGALAFYSIITAAVLIVRHWT